MRRDNRKPRPQGHQRSDRQMFKAVCDNCGDACEVPFRPTGNKPVLCDGCFSADRPSRRNDNYSRDRRGDSNDGHRSGRSMGEGRSEHYDQEFKKLNDKLDKILKRLTPIHDRNRPTEGSAANTDLPEQESIAE